MPKYEVIIHWSDEDQAFIAEVPELPDCAADRRISRLLSMPKQSFRSGSKLRSNWAGQFLSPGAVWYLLDTPAALDAFRIF
jgi:hypothetical protein